MGNYETMEYGCLWNPSCGATGWMARGRMMMCIMQSVVCGSKTRAKWESSKGNREGQKPKPKSENKLIQRASWESHCLSSTCGDWGRASLIHPSALVSRGKPEIHGIMTGSTCTEESILVSSVLTPATVVRTTDYG
jgi:hypothetical protein